MTGARVARIACYRQLLVKFVSRVRVCLFGPKRGVVLPDTRSPAHWEFLSEKGGDSPLQGLVHEASVGTGGIGL